MTDFTSPDDLWLEYVTLDDKDLAPGDLASELLDDEFEEIGEFDTSLFPTDVWRNFQGRSRPESRPPDERSDSSDEVTWGEAHATASTSKTEFCEKAKHLRYFKGLAVSEVFEVNENCISFANHGGLLGKGVCWWYSRFQRNVFYLTTYRPALPRPSRREAKEIIAKIRRGRAVVEIPGFKNFGEFSIDHEDLIQRALERWQIFDGIVLFSWINGLAGKSELPASELRQIMDELYARVECQHHIAYVKVATPTIGAHAWLVVGMRPTYKSELEEITGYTVRFLDSNSAGGSISTLYYSDGMTSLAGRVIPYVQREGDFDRYAKAIRRYCERTDSGP